MFSQENSTEIIRYNIAAEERLNFEKAYLEAGKYLQASKYCLSYAIFKGDEEPNHYVLVIQWTSKEDHLEGFRKSEEFSAFFTLVKPYYNQIEEMKHYHLTDMQWERW
jgi:quinol monooxygenase YgiN